MYRTSQSVILFDNLNGEVAILGPDAKNVGLIHSQGITCKSCRIIKLFCRKTFRRNVSLGRKNSFINPLHSVGMHPLIWVAFLRYAGEGGEHLFLPSDIGSAERCFPTGIGSVRLSLLNIFRVITKQVKIF